tara:strand:+ start:263 stop:532 length:270 start_codon:yes stop_codon:yes gene_type:complete
MEKIFIILVMNVWSNGEPEIIQYGSSVLGQSFSNRKDCEASLMELSAGQNLTREKGLNGIARTNLVYRSRDIDGRVDQEYSCLEVNFSQ